MALILAIIVAAAVAFVIGMVWYGPLLGEQWRKLGKVKKKDMKPAPKTMVLALARQLVTAIIIVQLFISKPVEELATSLGQSLFLTVLPTIILIWLGFTAMPGLSDVLWLKKPFKLYAINVGYELVSFVAMALVITWF